MNPHRVSKVEAQQRAKADVVIETGRFRRLPTLEEMRARPRAVPKFAIDHAVGRSSAAARLERALAKQKQSAGDRKKLYAWAQKVKKRDEWLDRCDRRPVLKVKELHPRRAESHHIVPRADKAVRYDVRNGICLSLENHSKVEMGQLRIVGTKFFTVGGTRYIDATFPVTFE
jgi:hypothetical protein